MALGVRNLISTQVLTKQRDKGHVIAAMQRLLRDPPVPGTVEEGQCGRAGLRARRLIQ
jgi:hypothetical protein